MKILNKYINAGVNDSQFIGERGYRLSYQSNMGGKGILAVDNMGRSLS